MAATIDDLPAPRINYIPLELEVKQNLEIEVTTLYPDDKSKQDLDIFFQEKGTTDILILLPVLDEEPTLLQRTLESIQKNIYEGNLHNLRIGVVIIYEGWKNFYSKYTQVSYSKFFDSFVDLNKMKFSMKRSNITGFKPSCDILHCFSTKTNLQNPSRPMLRVMFCIKHQRATRLHTHLWFMQGICMNILPKFILHLVPGSRPRKTAIRTLWNYLDENQTCGAVTGDLKPSTISMFNFIVAAQTIEYKFVNTFENTMETLFGQVSFLPEQFSMIRWSILQDYHIQEIYFKSLLDKKVSMIKANFFNSHERVMPYLISRYHLFYRQGPSNKYTINYTHQARCEIEVPSDMLNFLKLKHGYINSSVCSIIRFVSSFGLFMREESLSEKVLRYLQVIWSFFNLLFLWLVVGIFGVTFMVTLRDTYPDYASREGFNILDYIILFYYVLILIVLLMSIGSSAGSVKTYYTISIIWRAYMFSLIAMFIYAHRTLEFREDWMIWLLVSVALLIVLVIWLYSAFRSLIFCLVPFILMFPTYINILSIYAMCNLHDCTYSKDPADVTNEERQQMIARSKDRAYIVCKWCVSNYIFVYVVNKEVEANTMGYIFSYAIGCAIILMISVRLVFALFNALKFCVWNNSELSKDEIPDADPRQTKRLETPSTPNLQDETYLVESPVNRVNRANIQQEDIDIEQVPLSSRREHVANHI
jgi:chitin synthase